MRVVGSPGEYTAPNELTAPQGAALRAVNVVVQEQNEYRTHVGLEAEPLWTGRTITAVTHYSGTLVAHAESAGKLAYLSGGAWVEVPGTYNAPAGEPMDFAELQGNLFFTTDEGVYRWESLTATPALTGLPPGLAGTGATTGSSGFLAEGFGVAYRWHWAFNVDNGGEGRLVEGAPGARLVVVNATGSGSSKNTSLSIPIPDGLPASAYLRLFRSDDTPEDILPTDEVRQVYEREPTSAELTAGTMTVVDETPAAVRGASAYYSANTGDGIGESNFTAPICKRLLVFNTTVMGTCVTARQRLALTILGVGAPSGLTDDQGLLLRIGGYEEEYRGAAAEAFPDVFQVHSGGTAAQNLARTVDSLVRAINSRSGGIAYAAATDTDGSSPGGLIIEARALGSQPIEAVALNNASVFVPALQARLIILGGASVTRTANVVTVTTTSPSEYVVGQQTMLIQVDPSPDQLFPAGPKVVTAVTPTSFSYAEVGPNAVGSRTRYIFDSGIRSVTTTTGTADNAYAWAKEEQPDHWSLANFGTVGSARDELQWGLPMDRLVFMGSTSGLYRLQGNATDGFGLVDNGVWSDTYRFLGRRNVAKVAGRGYALSRTGIVGWTESVKPEPVDGPIQEEVRALLASHADNLGEYGYFVGDDTAKRLYVFVTSTPSGTKPDLAFMLNLNVSPPAWTRLTDTFPGLSAGTQGPGIAPAELGGQLHLLPTTSTGRVLKARNTVTDADYQGPAGEALPASVQYLPWTAGEPERYKMWTHVRIFTRAPLTQLQFAMATDLVPEEYEQTLPDMGPLWLTTPRPAEDPIRSYAWPSLVGQNHMRAKQISFRVSHATAGEPFRLLGVEVKHRAYGP